MDSELWAALLGAVVGGLFAAGVQEVSLRRQRAGRLADLRITTLLKLVRMQADHGATIKLIEEGIAFGAFHKMSASQATKPAINHPEPIEITPDELHAVLQTKDNELVNKMLTVSSRHRTMIALGKKYAEVRDRMTDLSGGAPQGAYNIGRVELSGEPARKYFICLNEAQQLLDHSYAISGEQIDELRWMIRALNAHTIRLGDSDLVLQANDQPSGQPSSPTA